ncbi:MAG: YfhO family protein, partial [Anaerolineae bacterium]
IHSRSCVLRLAMRAWLLLALAMLVGLGVAAVQLLPTAELALLSQRQSGAEYEFAMTYSFWPWRLFTLFAPDFFGNPAKGDYWGYANYWEDCGYVGVLPLLLALIAISIYLRQKRGRRTFPIPYPLSLIPFFSLLCFLSLLLAMGKNLPLYPLVFRWVPGFGFFQAPARFLYLYTLGMATLAGLGADLIGPSRRLERVSGYGVVIGLAILLATAAIRLLPLPPVKLTFVSALARFAVLLAIASLLLIYRRRAEFRSRGTKPLIKLPYRLSVSPLVLWQTLVIAFIAADLIIFGHALNPTTEPRLYELSTVSGAFLKREDEDHRIFTFSGSDYDLKFKKYLLFDNFGPDDVDWLMGLRETLTPNLAIGQGLFSTNNFDPLVVGHYQRLMQEIDKGLPQQIDPKLGRTVDKDRLPVALRLLSLMNVKYILDYGQIPNLNLVFADGVRIYGNGDALPRAYVVSQARVISDDEELLAELLSQSFDPRRTVLLRSAPSRELLSYPPISLIPLSLEYSPNAVEIEITLDRDGYLVLSDTYYPGWRAYVDGEEKEILRANYAFRAVPLESGQHTVLFQYDPLSFKLGLAISLATWGAIILGLALPGLQPHR